MNHTDAKYEQKGMLQQLSTMYKCKLLQLVPPTTIRVLNIFTTF